MKGLELGILYVAVGLGAAVAVMVRAQGASWLDAGLLVVFWPLYGPFFLVGTSRRSVVQDVLPRAEGIERRLAHLAARTEEIDRLLEQPDFRIEDAEAQRAAHEARGEHRAAERVGARIESIRALERRKKELSEGMAEARELIAQLRVRTELMRVAGGATDDTPALVEELELRLAGLDAMLEG